MYCTRTDCESLTFGNAQTRQPPPESSTLTPKSVRAGLACKIAPAAPCNPWGEESTLCSSFHTCCQVVLSACPLYAATAADSAGEPETGDSAGSLSDLAGGAAASCRPADSDTARFSQRATFGVASADADKKMANAGSRPARSFFITAFEDGSAAKHCTALRQ